MKRRGFTFLEVLIALVILAVISASLMPLMTGMARSDRTIRDRALGWRTAQTGLTSLYVGDMAGWKAMEENPSLRLSLDEHAATNGAGWNKMTVTDKDSNQSILVLYLEKGQP